MNMQEINAFRAAHGLQPLTPRDTREQKKRQAANAAARAQANRDLRNKRSSKTKG